MKTKTLVLFLLLIALTACSNNIPSLIYKNQTYYDSGAKWNNYEKMCTNEGVCLYKFIKPVEEKCNATPELLTQEQVALHEYVEQNKLEETRKEIDHGCFSDGSITEKIQTKDGRKFYRSQSCGLSIIPICPNQINIWYEEKENTN